MAYTRTLNLTCAAGDITLGGTVAVTANGSRSVSESCPASGTTTVALSIDVSALKLIFMVSDEDIEVEFHGPDTQVELTAGVPFVWFSTSELANPFGSTDVTSLDVTNGIGNAANLQIEILTDPTP